MAVNKELENRFKYHRPNEADAEKCADIRHICNELSRYIDIKAPNSREKSLAITKLEEVMMWTIAAIVRNSENGEE